MFYFGDFSFYGKTLTILSCNCAFNNDANQIDDFNFFSVSNIIFVLHHDVVSHEITEIEFTLRFVIFITQPPAASEVYPGIFVALLNRNLSVTVVL